MLLDPETLALAAGVERLLGPPGLKTELFSCLVETNTRVCETADELLDELVRLRELARSRAHEAGLAVAATGSHPFSQPEEQEIVQEPRYLAMLAERPAARRQLVCGLHVHVGMKSFEHCLATLEAILPWLPAVLALSVNSPYLEGAEPGSLSGRAGRLLELPRSGAPPVLDSVATWERVVAAAGGDYTRIWWDVRPHPRFGTLEVRIADQQTSVTRAAAFAALVQALCVAALRPRRAAVPRPVPRAACRGRARPRADGRAAGARRAGGTGARLVGPRRRAPGAARGACDSSRSESATGRRRSRRTSSLARRRPLGWRGVLRAAFYPLRLVAARLGRRNGPALVVVIGIAAGAAVVFGGRTLTTVAQDRAVSQAIERIPDGSRSVRAVWFGLPGSGDEPQPVLERARAPRPRRRGRRQRNVARPLPRDDDRRVVRRPRRRRAARPLGDAPQRPAAAALHRRSAARSCGSAASGRLPQPAGLAARRGRHGGARQPDPLRRLPRSDRQRARGRGGQPGGRRRGRVPPARRRRRSSWRTASARSQKRPALDTALPELRVGLAARARASAALGDRPARGRRHACAVGAAGGLDELRPDRARRGAPRRAGREPCGRAPARARRRRGRRAALRLRDPGRADVAPRSPWPRGGGSPGSARAAGSLRS